MLTGALKLTDWLAIYGAILSTALALGKGWSYFFGVRSVVRVTLGLGNTIEMLNASGQPIGPPKRTFLVGVINRSMHPVKIDGLALVPMEGKPRWIVSSPALGISIPFEVPAHGRTNVPLPCEEPLPFKLRRVVVHLATGEKVTSNVLDE